MEWFLIFALILVVGLPINLGEDFCEKNPKVLYCHKDSPCSLDPKCGETSKEVVGFGPDEAFLRKEIVRDINNLRKEMANGKIQFDGQTYPSGGDMVEIKWNIKLERSAQNFVKHCTTEHSDVSIRPLENMTEVSEYLNMEYNTSKIPDEEFWDNSLNSWKKIELGLMKPYLTKPNCSCYSWIFMPLVYLGCGYWFTLIVAISVFLLIFKKCRK